MLSKSKIGILDIIEMANRDETVSDIHIATGSYFALRKNGDIFEQQEYGIITPEFMESFIKHLMQSDTDMFAKFQSQKDLDFSYLSTNGINYRVNVFMTMRKAAVVMRKINRTPRKLESLMYEDIANSIKNNILSRKTGLFLVT